MAANKLGTLVYDLVADTDEFQKGLVEGGRRLTALKKLFLESRTPVESFGIQLQGMRKLIADGAAPINMFSRSIADLALKTKGGGREAREFAESLRLEARQIIAAASAQKNFSKENLTAASNMIKAANAIDAETNSVRRSAAEKLKNKRALEQETAAAKEADAEQKRLSQEREKQIAIERRQADQRIAYQKKIDRLRQQSRARAKSEGIRQAEQQEAARLAMVRSELQKTISPQKRLVSLAAAARAEYAAGNITQKELLSIQKRITEQLRELNPELKKEADERKKLAEATAKQAKEEEKLNAERRKQAQAIRDRQDPRKALAREMTEIRALGAAGMLSPAEVAAEQKRIANSIRQLNPAVQEQQARLQRVRLGLENLITPADRIQKEMRELKQEFESGNVSAKDYSNRLKQLKRELEDTKKVGKDKDAFNPFKGMGAQVGALIKQIAVITLMYKTLRQVSESVRDALEIERVQKQFEIFTGSAGSAQALMSELRDFAARTPLSLEMSTQATRTLLSYGVEQENVIDILRRLGDISGGSAERLQRLALAFGQVRGQTRLMGQENRQLVEGGFSPLNIIAEQTGESMFSLRQRMADGEVTFRELYETLRIATDEGGRFGNALERIGSETNIGQIQRLRGEYENLRAAAGESITDVLGDFAGLLNTKLAEERENIRKMLEEDISTTLEDVEGYFFTYMSPIRKLILEMERSRLLVQQDVLDVQKEETLVNERLTQQVHDRIAAIKQQIQEEKLGREEAEIARLRASDADQKAVDLLEEQLRLLKEISDEEKRRASEKERLQRAREIYEAVQGEKTPLQELEAGLRELKGLEDVLDLKTIKEARQLLFKEFADKEVKDLEEAKDATAAARGSIKEFELLKQIDREAAVERRHKEAMEAAKGIADRVDEGNRDRRTTAQQLADAFSDAMPESISSGRVTTNSFGAPFSGN